MLKTRAHIGGAGFQPARGQALIIAVLVLFAVATLAALFAAIISSHLVQVTRHSEVVQLRNIAEAGLRLANEQLTYSREGADWRPVETSYRSGGAEVRVEVTCAGASQDQQGRFMTILASAVFPGNPFLRHTIVGLKPVLLTDYARFITDRFETDRPAALGVTGLELGGAPRPDYRCYVEGPIRSNTDLLWAGQSELHLYTPRGDRVEVAGSLLPDPSRASGDYLQLFIDDVSRATDLFAPRTSEEQADYLQGFGYWWEGAVTPNSQAVLANLPSFQMLFGEWLSPAALAVPRVRPPEMDAVHPDLHTNRYLLLTRDSGRWERAADGAWYNNGEFGWGWTNSGGVYVDNSTDIQYAHDLEKLRLNWMASVGDHQNATPSGDEREAGTQGPLSGPADWWDKTDRYYAPPGVEIILHGEAQCPYVEIRRHDDPDGDGAFWRDPSGAPASDYPYSPAGGACSPPLAEVALGIEGNIAYFPFPPNGVIYTEGNARVLGIMPPARDRFGRVGANIPANEVPNAYFGEPDPTTGYRDRRFDLQIVSGGTIYIEGDLLTPGAAGLIPNTYADDKRYGSRLALLARDYVCVNTTALNPRPAELFPPGRVHPGWADTIDRTYHYNDWYPNYPPGGYPPYWSFRGPVMTDADAVARYPDPSARIDPIPTEPASLDLTYRNVRLQNTQLRSQLADLRLILGHSGAHSVADAKGNWVDVPTPPPAPVPPSTDEPSVDVSVSVGGVNLPWQQGGARYTFVRPDELPDPPGDNSGHWYTNPDFSNLTDDDYLEFLPDQHQEMRGIHNPTAEPLPPLVSGNDIISITSRVAPIRRVQMIDGVPTVTEWQVPPQDLGYLLGPIAITPPRGALPLPVEINALVYAQNGSWFIIPGPWFNEDPDELGLDPTQQQYPGYHEPLNIQITFDGAITENMPADPGSVADWTSKWGGPVGRGVEGFLSYTYDPLLGWPRWETQARVPYLRFPNFLLTPELVIWGERMTGAPSESTAP